MMPRTLLAERMRSHRLTSPAPSVLRAAEHMLAVQSQDFLAGRWALASRTRGQQDLRAVDAAFDRGELVRAWTMRGTLHTIQARDLGWVLSVTAERQRRQAATRHRQLGIDRELLDLAAAVLLPVARDGGLTRAQAFAVLERAGIDPSAQRGVHVLIALTLDGLICFGPVEARDAGATREQRIVAVDQHIRVHARPDDPLAELFVRYIDGHGPAGVADFAWWSGLTLAQAREARSRAGERVREVGDGLFLGALRPRRAATATEVFALAAFDEYYLSYADRTGVCDPDHLAAVGPGSNGMVRATLVVRGRVVGCWSHAAARLGEAADLFDAEEDQAEIQEAIRRFRRFLDG